MRFAATTLLVGAAAAANVTVTNYLFTSVNGYPAMSFRLSADGVSCYADHFVENGTYPCNDPAWTFTLDADAYQGNSFTLNHTVTCQVASAHFHIPINGPLSTVLGQIGLGVTEELVTVPGLKVC